MIKTVAPFFDFYFSCTIDISALIFFNSLVLRVRRRVFVQMGALSFSCVSLCALRVKNASYGFSQRIAKFFAKGANGFYFITNLFFFLAYPFAHFV